MHGSHRDWRTPVTGATTGVEPRVLVPGDVAACAGRPAVFLDRDGVLIENRKDHVKDPSEVVILPGAIEAVRQFHAAGIVPIVVTNQGGVGRGLLTMPAAVAVQEYVVARYGAAGAALTASYLCPHPPWVGCGCRKPAPGMLLAAARSLRVDLTRSVVVGDALTDLEAGEAAGLPAILVLTGRGRDQLRQVPSAGRAAIRVQPSLIDAVGEVVAYAQAGC